jgi:hypothetical protein
MYKQCLDKQIIPMLKEYIDKYSEWWSFKIYSPLNELINGRLDLYFRPEELINIILEEAKNSNCFELGNSEIIVANERLQKCFNTNIIFAPNLYVLCLSHINVLTDASQIETLKNKNINSELWIETPYDILYKDPTAQFWLHPIINQIICGNKQITYSWETICDSVNQFICNSNVHFTRHDKNIFSINTNSPLCNEFRFQYFHKSQIPFILKQITKYLGKKHTLLSLCPELHQNESDLSTVYFIEELMFGNNRLLPHMSSATYI